MDGNPTEAVKAIVDRWCDRHDYGLLAVVLPSWLGNHGLTDGWADLRDALRTAYGMGRHLPPDERDELKRLYVKIDVALRNR